MTYQEQLTKILEDYRDRIVMSVAIGKDQPELVGETRDAINALNKEAT